MSGSSETRPYRVLARTYRPSRFADLVGQEAMVRTLANAITSGRLAHAFILTGIRGVGKTTTARIIARALNCVGADGTGGPTPDPCGTCDHCASIGEDRHVDVIEMDAASRTGVDDIRELIEGVRYRPVSARFKVYIIDEVHMLSRNAFNALLKTLEEPPEHVKFIFATTEIRKVPVTVLSRCQRFDLRRVDGETLFSHLGAIAGREDVEIAEDALRQIVRAAEGSVRDALSLLDQAIAHAAGGRIDGDRVREMLGLADRLRTADLLEALMRGEPAAALGLFDTLHEAGADPVAVLQDLLEFTHWLTRLKAAPEDARAGGAVSDIELERGRTLAAGLSVPVLTRCWQILLKGVSETHMAVDPRQAAEMVLIRLAYAADLPTPAEIIRAAESGETVPPPQPAPPAPAPGPPRRCSPCRRTSRRWSRCSRAGKRWCSTRIWRTTWGSSTMRPGGSATGAASTRPTGWRTGSAACSTTGPESAGRWRRSTATKRRPACANSARNARPPSAGRRRTTPAVQAALQMFPGATVEAVRSVESAPILGEAVPREPPTDPEDDAEAESPHGELPP